MQFSVLILQVKCHSSFFILVSDSDILLLN